MLKRILELLGWLGVALVFSALAIRFTKPEWQQYYVGLALAGLACTLLYILSQWREIGRSFSGRQARLGSIAAASVIVVLAILVAINYLASRYNKRWDLTAAKQFSISDQTKKVLHGLQQPVHIRVFDRTEGFPKFHERLDEYQYASKQVSVEYIDLERRPALANQFKVQTEGTVVIEYAGRTEKVTSDGEQELTNGLIKAVQGKQHKLYFVQGHGEKSLDAERLQLDWLGADLGQLPHRQAGAGAAEGRAGGRLDAGRRRTQDGLLPGRDRVAQALSRQRGQGVLPARSAGPCRCRRAHQPDCAHQGMGHRHRHQHRR